MKHQAFATTLKDLPLLTNLQIASRILEGELSLRRGNADAAIAALREAVTIEDGIPYNEPPVWHHPPRQILGAILLEAGRAADAEAVYREDLKRVPRERVVALRAREEPRGAAAIERGARGKAAVREGVGARGHSADLVANHGAGRCGGAAVQSIGASADAHAPSCITPSASSGTS